jgi:hypothetical protein
VCRHPDRATALTFVVIIARPHHEASVTCRECIIRSTWLGRASAGRGGVVGLDEHRDARCALRRCTGPLLC